MISKIKEIIKTLFWPILFGIGQFFICGLLMLVYMLRHPEINFDDSSSNSILIKHINDQTLLIVVLECIVFIPIFHSIYKKYQMNKVSCTISSLLKMSFISFLLSSVLNFIIIVIKHFIGMKFSDSSITITTILATGIVGPVLEEFIFRGIVYGKFLHIFKEKTAFYLSILVFAFFHITGGIFQIFFAAIIGYFLTFIYKKYHDIRLSIMAHIIVNVISILLSPFVLLLF